MSKDQWMGSRTLGRFLASHRDNDVRVNVEGMWVPVISAEYDRFADVIGLHLDETGDDYLMALGR